MKIGINDGHTLSGKNTGAIGIIKETDRNRRVGNLVRKMLAEEYQCEVINLSIDKSDNDLVDIVAKANNSNVDVFISLHANIGKGVGFETFYNRFSTTENINHAKTIHAEICSTNSCLANRRCTSDYGYLGYDLYVLRNTKMEAILIELGFIDNQRCVDAFNDTEVAKALVVGIAKAYNIKKREVVKPTGYYRVICGSFRDKSNATIRKEQLEKLGFDGVFLEYK